MSRHLNQPLSRPLRSQLENTVKSARDVAEKAALAALRQLAVSEAKAPDYLSDDLKASLEARGCCWLPVTKVPTMAYDHDEVLAYARERFKRRVNGFGNNLTCPRMGTMSFNHNRATCGQCCRCITACN